MAKTCEGTGPGGLLLALGLAGMLALAGAARAADARIEVTFINPGGAAGFWGCVSDTMRSAAEDLRIDLEVVDTGRDRVAMVEAARQVSARDAPPDYVVLVNELLQGPPMVEALAAAEIPTFFLLNGLTSEQRRSLPRRAAATVLGSIVPDNESAGYEMARILVQAVRRRDGAGADVRMLALLGDAATPAAVARERGLRRALDGDARARLLRAFPVFWNGETARRRTRDLLRFLEVDAIWAANDDIALGATEAAREHGLRPGRDVFVAGLNWSEAGLAAVASGDLVMTHGGHFFAGAWAMVLLRDIHDGRLASGFDLTFEMSGITPSSVAQFQALFGDRNWSEVDFARLSLAGRPREDYDLSAGAILRAAACTRPGAATAALTAALSLPAGGGILADLCGP